MRSLITGAKSTSKIFLPLFPLINSFVNPKNVKNSEHYHENTINRL